MVLGEQHEAGSGGGKDSKLGQNGEWLVEGSDGMEEKVTGWIRCCEEMGEMEEGGVGCWLD